MTDYIPDDLPEDGKTCINDRMTKVLTDYKLEIQVIMERIIFTSARGNPCLSWESYFVVTFTTIKCTKTAIRRS